MHVTAKDFFDVTQRPKAVWARLFLGVEPPESEIFHSIQSVVYDRARDDAAQWLRSRHADLSDIRSLASMSWPAPNDVVDFAIGEALSCKSAVVGGYWRAGILVASPFSMIPTEPGHVEVLDLCFKTVPDDDDGQNAFKRLLGEEALKASFNAHVLEANQLVVDKYSVAFLGHGFVKGVSAEPGLFVPFLVSDEFPKLKEQLNQGLSKIEELTQSVCPPINPDEYCPRTDDHDLPPQHVFLLKQGETRALRARKQGIKHLKDIPIEKDMSRCHTIQIKAAQSGSRHIDAAGIGAFIGQLRFPVHYLDFETYCWPTPQFAQSRPHQDIPFEFSLYIRRPGKKKLERHHFQHSEPTDPRPAIMKALEETIEPEGSIVVFAKNAEENILKDLARDFPAFKPTADRAIERLVDLYTVFREFRFYDPRQSCKTRFKAVLPVLTGTSYDDLKIRNGQEASGEYLRVVFGLLGRVTEEERKATLANGAVYCDQDSWGMDAIVRELEHLSSTTIEGDFLPLSQQRQNSQNLLLQPPVTPGQLSLQF